MAADSGRLREACESRAHGKRTGPIGYKLSRGEGRLLTGLRHDHPAHRYLSGIPAWQRTNTDRPLARIPCPQVLQRHPGVANGASDRSSAQRPCPQIPQGHPGVAKGASGRSLARPPCPQLPQGHPGVAKNHLTKDKPVSARCKDQLSYCRAYRQTYRMVSYVGLSDHQTGLPYRQPYLKLSPQGHMGHPYRPPYRQVSSARLSDLQTARLFRTPDRTPDRQPDRPTLPTSLT